MNCEIEYADEFGSWWSGLNEAEIKQETNDGI